MAHKFGMKVRLVAALICHLLLSQAHGDDGGQCMTGGDTTRTEQMMVEVDEKQQEVIDQGLALGKFLGTLLVDTAAILLKVEEGLLTGDVVMCYRVATAGRRW
jgi:hypothetical protein